MNNSKSGGVMIIDKQDEALLEELKEAGCVPGNESYEPVDDPRLLSVIEGD